MSTHRVVEKLDVFEHICPGFVSCFVSVLLDSLGLEYRGACQCPKAQNPKQSICLGFVYLRA